MNRRLSLIAALALFLLAPNATSQEVDRPRARDLGIEAGIFPPGPLNAITDVEGVLVGQVTIVEGDRVNTGLTAIRPHPGSIYHERVPAAIYVGNGFGKLLGVTQIRELGELETPILLTCTLCVWKAADALVEWAFEQEGMERVGSLNAVVGETNDGGLNDIRNRPIDAAHLLRLWRSPLRVPWPRVLWVPGGALRRSGGKAESARAAASFPRAWAALRSASWSNRTSEGS